MVGKLQLKTEVNGYNVSPQSPAKEGLIVGTSIRGD